MAMPGAKGLFHRAIVQSGPFLKSLSPDYSGRLAELVVAELGLSKSQLDELQTIPVDRLSGAAAEAMKKMPAQKSSLRTVYGEDNWGPTVDGRILPRHPFDPGAPEISADVPLLTGTNLHDAISGLDRADANAMRIEEVHRLVGEEFGDRAKEIIDAYHEIIPKAAPFDLYATIAAAPFRRPCLRAGQQEGRFGRPRQHTLIYILGGRPCWTIAPVRFTPAEIAFTSTMLEFATTTVGALRRDLFCRSKSVQPWVNFARTGNPNHNALPHWPAYTSEHRATMYFDTPCAVRNEPEAEGLKLMAKP